MKCECALPFQDVADNQIDSGDLMECLIQNKHQKDMNEKCAIGVTHFQLVSNTGQGLVALTALVKNCFLPIHVLFLLVLVKCVFFLLWPDALLGS